MQSYRRDSMMPLLSGVMIDIIFRSLFFKEAPWDLFALVIVGSCGGNHLSGDAQNSPAAFSALHAHPHSGNGSTFRRDGFRHREI